MTDFLFLDRLCRPVWEYWRLITGCFGEKHSCLLHNTTLSLQMRRLTRRFFLRNSTLILSNTVWPCANCVTLWHTGKHCMTLWTFGIGSISNTYDIMQHKHLHPQRVFPVATFEYIWKYACLRWRKTKGGIVLSKIKKATRANRERMVDLFDFFQLRKRNRFSKIELQ